MYSCSKLMGIRIKTLKETFLGVWLRLSFLGTALVVGIS